MKKKYEEPRFLEPLCRKRVWEFFYISLQKMGKDYESYDLSDAELERIRRDFEELIKLYNEVEQEIMRKEFIELYNFYKRKRDEINLPYT